MAQHGQDMSILLGPSEFSEQRDQLGLFNQQEDSFEFLSIEHSNSDRFFPINKTIFFNDTAHPVTSASIYLSNKSITHERAAYTFMILLADVGGLYGSLIILPSIFLGAYSARMYHSSLLEGIQTKPTKKRKGANAL